LIQDVEVAQDFPSFLGCEDAGERAGLAQPYGALVWRGEKAEQLVQRAIKQRTPFEKRGAHSVGSVPEPAFQIVTRDLSERRLPLRSRKSRIKEFVESPAASGRGMTIPHPTIDDPLEVRVERGKLVAGQATSLYCLPDASAEEV